MAKRVLPLIPSPLVVDHVELSSEAISIHCRFRSHTVRCPDCLQASQRFHSRYERQLADLPWQGRSVTIALNIRRLRCGNHRCRRRTFAERHDDVVRRYCRRTRRLAELHRCVGVALGGEAGARLVARLGMQVSADTILRIVRSEAVPEFKVPRILGVDDWAWRRGQRYGTVLVDLETNDVVDLLPDREMSTPSTWLKDHPGVEIIARDRAGAYARGAREGAPKAQQVADRWHLLRNCSDALQNVVERRYRLVRDIGKSLVDRFVEDGGSDGRPEDRAVLPAPSRRQYARHKERRALFDEMVRLAGIGWSQLAIRRELGIDLKTIRKWLKDEQPGTWRRTVFTPNPADIHEDYVRRRWGEGCRNATRLYREVCDRGYPGNAKTFRQWVKIRLRDGHEARPLPANPTRSSWRIPSSRQTTRLLTASPDTLPIKDRAFVDALCKASPDIAVATGLARRFQCMVCDHDPRDFRPWLRDAMTGPLSSLARGIRSDMDAVEAALELPWSTGPVEGKINKLKLIKRSMYGRANIDLLRCRIIG